MTFWPVALVGMVSAYHATTTEDSYHEGINNTANSVE